MKSAAGQWWNSMNPEVEERFLGRYTAADIAALNTDQAVVVLPLGAMEQHGPHLPLFTDALVVQSLVAGVFERLPKGHPFYFLYPLGYSYSMEHADFPGTITLQAETTMRVLMDVAESLARSGFHKLVVINGHGGNIGVLHVAAREIRIRTGLSVFVIHGGSLVEKGMFGDYEGEHGIHAGASETSLLMSQMPEWVQAERSVSEYPELAQSDGLLTVEGNFPVAWKTRDISQSGVVGDATMASAETGDLLFQGMVLRLAAVFEEIAAYQADKSKNPQEGVRIP